MTPGRRQQVVLVAGAALLALFLYAATGLPDFGHYRGPYGFVINHVAGTERGVTNAVTSLVFDYRGYDTLGEELILFVSVVGVTTLLRAQRDEREQPTSGAEAEQPPGPSPALRAAGPMAAALTLLVGLYVVAHGSITPGGGFQGGVVLGTGVLMLFLAGDVVVLRRMRPAGWMEVLHSAGAGGLALLALGGLLAGGQFFHNFLWTGVSGELTSGGIIPLGNAAVGLEVMGATVLLAAEFLRQIVLVRETEQR